MVRTIQVHITCADITFLYPAHGLCRLPDSLCLASIYMLTEKRVRCSGKRAVLTAMCGVAYLSPPAGGSLSNAMSDDFFLRPTNWCGGIEIIHLTLSPNDSARLRSNKTVEFVKRFLPTCIGHRQYSAVSTVCTVRIAQDCPYSYTEECGKDLQNVPFCTACTIIPMTVPASRLSTLPRNAVPTPRNKGRCSRFRRQKINTSCVAGGTAGSPLLCSVCILRKDEIKCCGRISYELI